MSKETELPSLPAIMYETGPDEAFLIGTEHELRGLAENILALLDRLEPAEESWGIRVRWATGYLTEEFGDVCLVSAAVTSSEPDTKKLINAIRENNGEAPIAGPGWPNWDSADEAA